VYIEKELDGMLFIRMQFAKRILVYSVDKVDLQFMELIEIILTSPKSVHISICRDLMLGLGKKFPDFGR